MELGDTYILICERLNRLFFELVGSVLALFLACASVHDLCVLSQNMTVLKNNGETNGNCCLSVLAISSHCSNERN